VDIHCFTMLPLIVLFGMLMMSSPRNKGGWTR
jgi:hypothetical protein